uniref:Uncharacterized protein n=1 Tax=Ditylum brightwellii TaxID=49249 RepID=A0A7S1YQ98_9STRA|mmetsp:Transcript_13210/g.19717  ORF Transcript_13210/g.19717 Transcript_13210/m.19717 type:complete len:327 (+) Transcript_13210:1-981(+)
MLKMQTPPKAVRHVPSQRFFFSSSSHLSGIDRWESSSSIGDVVYKKEGTEEKENDVILTPAGLSLEKHLESLSGMNNDNDGKSSSSSVKTTYSDEYHRSSSSSAVSSSSSLPPILPVEDLPFATLGELESYVTAIESVASLSITHAYTQQYLFPLVESCSNLRSQAGARLAERILACCLECVEQYRHMIDDTDNHDDEEYIVEWRDASHPTKDMYTMVTDSWGRCGTTGGYGARRAKLILDLMIDEYEREKNWVEKGYDLEQKKKRRSKKTLDAAKSDVVNYLSVMNAWAMSNVRGGPFEAENVSTFNTVIKTWARSGLPDSGERA